MKKETLKQQQIRLPTAIIVMSLKTNALRVRSALALADVSKGVAIINEER